MTTPTKRKPPTAAEILAKQKADRAPGGIAAKPPARNTAVAKPAVTDPAVPDNPWMEVSAVLDQFVGAPRLKFTKDGEFAISDTETLRAGTRGIAHVDAAGFDWVKWVDNLPAERRGGRVADRYKPVPRAELGDLDENQWEVQPDGTRRDPWQFQATLPITRLDTNETLDFTTGSKGGLRAVGTLLRAYGKRADKQPKSLPVIELQPDSYKHRQYGKIYVPALHIVGWTDDNGVPLSAADDFDDEIPHL
jgi:hypothetical protein